MFVYLLSILNIEPFGGRYTHASQVIHFISACRLVFIGYLFYASKVYPIGGKRQEVRRVDIDLVATQEGALG